MGFEGVSRKGKMADGVDVLAGVGSSVGAWVSVGKTVLVSLLFSLSVDTDALLTFSVGATMASATLELTGKSGVGVGNPDEGICLNWSDTAMNSGFKLDAILL